jgi:haloalkane dehalogenase
METLVAPVSWDGENAPDPELFGPLRTEEGERLVLRDNVFVEKVLPAGTDAPSPSTRGPPIGPPTCSPASRGVPR